MTTALVTGANKGIRFATSKALAQAGITVWLSARSAELGQKAAERLRAEGLKARFLQLDVTDQTSIDAAARTIEADGNGLDILINNAGIMTEFKSFEPVRIASPSDISKAEIRALFDINFFGVVAVTQALLPLLRKSQAGRIVNVGSRLGSSTMMSGPESPCTICACWATAARKRRWPMPRSPLSMNSLIPRSRRMRCRPAWLLPILIISKVSIYLFYKKRFGMVKDIVIGDAEKTIATTLDMDRRGW